MAPSLPRFRNTVGGREVDSVGGNWFETFDPYVGQAWAEIPRCGPADAEAAVVAAHDCFTSSAWRSLTASTRGKLLWRLADLIARDAAELAALEVRDNGKLLTEMAGQVRYIPEWFRYFGGLADKVEGTVPPLDKPDMLAWTRREPLGVVIAITPWNSPLLLLSWKLAPALAAGNTVVVKPSEFASASTLKFVALFAEAGFPAGAVNTVTGYGGEVGDTLVKHPLVAKVAFTGSEATGAAIGSSALGALRPVTLELGGKSPNIVFDDARLDQALNGAIAGIFAATGQTCLAGSRLLVHEKVYRPFVEKLTATAAGARLGNPMQPATQVGPITTLPQLNKVLSYIDIAKSAGARLLLGGGRPTNPELANGWFVEPTIFDDVDNTMQIAREEVFGPVLAIIPFADEEEAIAIANSNPYGLAAGVWTEDMRRAVRVAERVQAGTVWINTYRAVSYLAPFGGMKRSGIGRENGLHAIDEYLQTKTIWMNLAEDVPNPFVMR